MARAARGLAELYERRVNNLDAAARAWHRVDEADPKDPQAARALATHLRVARPLRRSGRGHRARAADGERSLEPERRLELWLKLGEIRKRGCRGRSRRPKPTRRRWRSIRDHGEALAALAEIYAATKRGDDLNRVLDLRAAATTDPQQRAACCSKKAICWSGPAISTARWPPTPSRSSSIRASRTCFTAYERVCYRRESGVRRWSCTSTAIRLVERQRSRAYRLADLYARRGQMQLQYLGQPGEAAASYLRVLELDPDADTAQTALERIFSAQSDWAGLISPTSGAASWSRDDVKRVEILRRAARVAAAKLKDAGRGGATLRAAALGRSHRRRRRSTRSSATTSAKRDWDKLVGMLTTRLSLTAGGDEAIALYMRIARMCEEGLRDVDRATEHYRKILELAPENREALEALGRIYESTEQWAELIDVTRRQIIVNDRAQKALLYFKCGSVMEAKFGREHDAIRYYDAAIKTSPKCLPAVHGLRDLYRRREEWPRVIETLELEVKLWTEDKERAGVFAQIGRIYDEQLGDPERAMQYYDARSPVDPRLLAGEPGAVRALLRRAASGTGRCRSRLARAEGDARRRSVDAQRVLSQARRRRRADGRSAGRRRELRRRARDQADEHRRARRLSVALPAAPDAWDFDATYRELEKVYKKRDDAASCSRACTSAPRSLERDGELERPRSSISRRSSSRRRISRSSALVSFHERLRRLDQAAVGARGVRRAAPGSRRRKSAAR